MTPPTPTPEFLTEDFLSVGDQISNGNSYKGEPGRGKNCSHCSFQDFHFLSKENQVSLVRTCFLHQVPRRWCILFLSLARCNALQSKMGSEKKRHLRRCTLDGQNRQSLAFSECGQVSQAIPRFHVERISERLLRDPSRSTMSTGPLRTNLCVLGVNMNTNER